MSGAVALLQARQRTLNAPLFSPHDVLLRLRETTDDISAINPSRSGYGTGRLNVARLLTDPPGSSGKRIGGLTVGPAVVIPSLDAYRFASVTSDGHLLIFEGRADTVAIVTLPAAPVSGLAAADLSPGAGVRLFVSLANGSVMGYDANGTPLSGWPVIAGVTSLLSMPALGDVDGDGVIEVVCTGDDGFVYAWHHDGLPATGFPVDISGPSTGVALSQLDGVAGVEIVVINTTGDAFVINRDGTSPAGWPMRLATPATAPVVGRLGTSSQPTILVGAGQSLVALALDGTQRFAVPLTSPSGGVAIQDPALGDLDGDGSDEIVIAVSGSDQLAVFDSAGAPFRRWPRPLPVAASGPPVIGQLRGGTDAQEVAVFAGDLLAFSDSAVALSPAFPKSGKAGAQPTLFPLDGDGSTEVIAETGPDSVFYLYDAGPQTASGPTSSWPTPRGNFARTGSRLYDPGITAPDLVAPAQVTDLDADSVGANGVRLAWTAPGDDGAAGTAARYELRRSFSRIDATNFDLATTIPTADPAPAGGLERATADALAPGITYFFALRTLDDVGNPSLLSNLVWATPGDGRPGRVLDPEVVATTDSSVTLRWSATGDDAPLGRPVRYVIYIGVEPIVDGNELDSREKFATVEPGLTESFVFDGLEPDRVYWFAVRAVDNLSTPSDLSNSISGRTQPSGPFAGGSGIAIASRLQPSSLPVDLYWRGAGPSVASQSIRIYDIGGRMRREIPLPANETGLAKWDGRDDRGDRVPAGIYYARLISGSVHAQTRVVLLP